MCVRVSDSMKERERERERGTERERERERERETEFLLTHAQLFFTVLVCTSLATVPHLASAMMQKQTTACRNSSDAKCYFQV